jgi:hypothetical protein
MLGVIEHVPDARFIVKIPVPLTTVQAVDAPAAKVTVPSLLEAGKVVTVTLS